ncbi:MAG: four helix bundle protein [Eubacterium sp.]|nr:four helix bundle protein [Eubacterium sp.]
MDLVDETYKLTLLLPENERFALSDQLRRSAVSVPSNIAEGQSRFSKNEFKHFLSIARGSVSELETQTIICIRQGFFTEEQASTALNLCEDVRKMLTKLAASL